MEKYLELLVAVGTLGLLMWGMMKFMLKDIHKDLLDIRSDIADLKNSQQRNETRIDHLYEIAIETLKTRR